MISNWNFIEGKLINWEFSYIFFFFFLLENELLFMKLAFGKNRIL